METLILLGPSRRQIAGDWSELTAHQRSVSLVLFCETLGMLLVSGVPILQAMQIVGDLLPAAQKKQLEEVRDQMREGERICLDHLGILPEFVIELIRHGEENGCLDAMLEKAADVFEQELECRSL
jgi:type II secretory pathway component PulF